MEWKSPEIKEENVYKIPERWLHIHYYEALNILFRFENSLRVFVYSIMKNEHFDEWKTVTFSIDGESKSIKNLASKRLTQAQNFGYLGYDIKCPIMHLTSGELVELITSEAYWPKFNSYFKGNRDIIKNKLLEIGNIRNSLAHFRPIKTDDIEVIKQNSRQTLMEVERCLSSLFNLTQKVPTNTDEDWYKNISTIGNDYVITNPLYSNDEKWVNLQLIFKIKTLNREKWGSNHFTYNLIRFITPNIINAFPDIAKYSTYVSEYMSNSMLDSDYNLHLNKYINLVFKKNVLQTKYNEISNDLKKITSIVAEEVELLVNDNLARGRILDTVNCSSWWTQKEDNKGEWNHSNESLKCPYEPDHPDEYWGNILYIGKDIVSGARIYPWMSSDISKFDWSF